MPYMRHRMVAILPGPFSPLTGRCCMGLAVAAVCSLLASAPGSAQTPGGSVVRAGADGTISQETSRTERSASEEEEDGCVETPTTMCLQGGRYAVSAEWSTLEGETGPARTVRARTPDSGLFWFFSPGNWEMLIKVLDGCTFNSHHWVFAASATDLGLDITVRDTQTGAVKRYEKDAGSPAPAVTDVGAFPLGCES